MAVFFRALVMLITLVGLPAAWVYYGPLPDGAQRIVDRFMEVAQDALGWNRPALEDSPQTLSRPPRFDTVLPTPPTLPQVSQASFDGDRTPTRPAGVVGAEVPAGYMTGGQQSEMQTHLSLLKQLGVAQYALEKWGAGYRFKCAVPLGDNPDFTQQFEVIDADPLATVRQVVGEVTSWQNARRLESEGATLWR